MSGQLLPHMILVLLDDMVALTVAGNHDDHGYDMS